MKKSMFAAAALAVLMPLAATAEELTPVTVNIEFDHALLASDAGAKLVMSSIRDQAREACRAPGGKFGRAASTDFSCVDDVTAKATVKILQQREAMGLTTAPAFAREATVQTAALEQR